MVLCKLCSKYIAEDNVLVHRCKKDIKLIKWNLCRSIDVYVIFIITLAVVSKIGKIGYT